jgi:hypothetical protein
LSSSDGSRFDNIPIHDRPPRRLPTWQGSTLV